MTNKDVTKMIGYTEFLEEDLPEEAPVRRRRAEKNADKTATDSGRRVK